MKYRRLKGLLLPWNIFVRMHCNIIFLQQAPCLALQFTNTLLFLSGKLNFLIFIRLITANFWWHLTNNPYLIFWKAKIGHLLKVSKKNIFKSYGIITTSCNDPLVTVNSSVNICRSQKEGIYISQPGISTKYKEVFGERQPAQFKFSFSRFCNSSSSRKSRSNFLFFLIIFKWVFGNPFKLSGKFYHFSQSFNMFHHTIVIKRLLMVGWLTVSEKILKIRYELVIYPGQKNVRCWKLL